jgi:hypothetical protein
MMTPVRFEPAAPQIFRVGDLIEAQVSFVVVPLKGKMKKMLTAVRCIALLNSDFTKVCLAHSELPETSATDNAQDAFSKRNTQDAGKAAPSIRRRVGYASVNRGGSSDAMET